MKYSECIQNAIKDFSNMGFSGRKIAKMLDLSKSGVNDYLRTLIENDRTQIENVKGPRILIIDVETAAATAMTFGRFKINLSQDNIVDEGGWILCASWRWLGEETNHSIHLNSTEVALQDDSRIVERMIELLDEADAIVAHNGCSFDHKVIQTRATFHGYAKLPTVKVLDTLLLARRYLRLPSNKLDSIGEYFGLGRKIDTGGIRLWKEVQQGSVQAMKDMVEYCQQDVDLLHDVYVKLRHLGTAGNAFNAALYYNDDKMRCNVCGSDELTPTERKVSTTVSQFDEYFCNSCGSLHKTRKSSVSKSKRSTLLSAVN